MKKVLTAALIGVFFVFAMAARGVTMDWVTVGDPGNIDEGYGGVADVYRISKYEVTNGQYIEFLNAVADTDTYDLYYGAMGGNARGGIARSGESGSYTYGPKGSDNNWLNRPVNYVNFWDACRFANWLHNGQPTGAQGLATTEDGVYFLNGVTNPTNEHVPRKAGAKIWIPSEDEWYKAAYYKGGGTNAGYWDYATQSNAAPTAELPPGTDMINGSANYNGGAGYLDTTYYSTEVGAYTAKPSDSAYGTFDQSGNMWEWNDSIIDTTDRGYRGGSFYNDATNMRATSRYDAPPTIHDSGLGFRIAEVPEPTCLAILALGGAGMLLRRRAVGG